MRVLRVFLGCVLTIVAGSLAIADLDDGLVAYYPFTGNANDATGNGHDGTVHGAVLVPDRYGIPNSAYYFDGDTSASAYIQIDTAIGEMRTVSLWMKPSRPRLPGRKRSNAYVTGSTWCSPRSVSRGKETSSHFRTLTIWVTRTSC